jgi:glycolate oxidase iron-sulfur subunit
VSFDHDQLQQCVSCGLCLSSCPTFSITKLEQHGPRGRIHGMRLVQAGDVDVLDPDYVASMETCVQCRACEDVCPSDVDFGALMERARSDIETARTHRRVRPPVRSIRTVRRLARRVLLTLVRRPRLLDAATVALRLVQRSGLDRLVPAGLRVAHRVRPARLDGAAPGDADLHLFRGCVMDRWFGDVHEAAADVLRAGGATVATARRGACCGALHLHAGDEATARRLAARTVAAFAGTSGPIVVDSAGCGAAMKEYGRLLDTPAAHAVAARVRDLGEVVDTDALALPDGPPQRLAWQAPCHLRYVQGVDDAARRTLAAVPGVTLVEGDDAQLCCGAGGAYSLLEPEFSTALRDRKVAALRRTGCDAVVTANPGCSMQLAAGGLDVVHVAQVVAAALPDRPGEDRT